MATMADRNINALVKIRTVWYNQYTCFYSHRTFCLYLYAPEVITDGHNLCILRNHNCLHNCYVIFKIADLVVVKNTRAK